MIREMMIPGFQVTISDDIPPGAISILEPGEITVYIDQDTGAYSYHVTKPPVLVWRSIVQNGTRKPDIAANPITEKANCE